MAVRILHVATRHRVGGAERNLLHTVSRQLDRGFEVHVAVGTEDLRDDFPEGTSVHPLPDLVREVSPRADRRALSGLQALVRNHEFHVVQTHQSKAGALGRMAARRSARLVAHTVHMASFGPAYGHAQSQMFLHLERRLARFTHTFIFVGAELQSRYQVARVAPPDRSIIVRSPITNLASLIELRGSRGDAPDRARASIGVPAAHQLVLMVGALDRRKRHALAIRALAPLLAEGNTELVIAGEGPERGALELLCSGLDVANTVHFVGFVRDVRPLYAVADVLLQASTLEGVPQAVVQATAAGVPAVATEVDGLREAAPSALHVSVVPPDGRGLLEAVRVRLARTAIPPAPPELVAPWLPETVDMKLSELHDWMEARAGRPRRPLRARRRPPARLPATLRVEELAGR